MADDPNTTLDFSTPTKPDGEVDTSIGKSADEKPGDPVADPENLAKDSQAEGGVLGTSSVALGHSSLGSSPGFAGTTEADVKAAVDSAPKPQGEVRKSWAESGSYDR